MSAPRFGPAVLRALAAWDAAREGWDACAELEALCNALDADRAVRAHPVPVGDEPDETRDASPFRFRETRTTEKL